MSAKVLSLSAARDARAGWEVVELESTIFPLGDGRVELRITDADETLAVRVGVEWLTQHVAKCQAVLEKMRKESLDSVA